ncbi:MAG: thioredoxin domain-containing protein [Candidatus Spechtbacterales bacterium]
MENKNLNMTIPGAIIIAGIIIAGAVVYSNGFDKNTAQIVAGDVPQGNSAPKAVDNIKPVIKDDHILGDTGAQVKIVEFSDFECPFCKRFHPTLKQVVEEYDGKVAWIYRHFPLDNLHSKARKEAEATECAAELGGNTAFWAYTDRLFEVTPSNNGLDLGDLSKIAGYISLDTQKFQECLDSGKYKDHISDDLADATNSGGQGTPYSVVIAANGKKSVIPGALPYEAVKEIIDKALSEN